MCHRRALLAAVALATCMPAAAAITCNGSNVAFSLGTYESFQQTVLDSSGIFTVTCTRVGGAPTVTVTVAIGPSLNSGTVATRQLRLAAGADLLAYNVYRDISRSLVWGNTAGTDTVSQTLTVPNNASLEATFTLFGRIDPLQDVRPGGYFDTLTATVEF